MISDRINVGVRRLSRASSHSRASGAAIGGIEAEAAMLGQPVSMLIPPVVGVELVGQLPPGVTATDLVLTLTERRHGVVGKFVEFFGEGAAATSIATRCTIANMSPESARQLRSSRSTLSRSTTCS